MKALLKSGTCVSVGRCQRPKLSHPNDVRIRVRVSGLCRTDLYVAQGLLDSPTDLVLGHEFSGTVEELGSEVRDLRIGQRVAVFPWLGCNKCAWCQSGKSTACARRQMLGVNLNGAFAEEIVVPASIVYGLPDEMSFQMGAYVEPVAASLAVLKAPIEPHQRGLVFGKNRIAELTFRLMKARGFSNLELGIGDYPDNSFDFVVETLPQQVSQCVRVLKPGGTLVIKSRHPEPIQLDLLQVVPKELRMAAVNYGDFQTSIQTLLELPVHDLLGPVHPLEDWQQLFAEANSDESTKRFFSAHAEDLCADWSAS